jgi:hypothetical protein
MNETLRFALSNARLHEVDVASQLGVDPKTVERWVAGRLPQRRHRWSLADLVGRNEFELWPQLVEPVATITEDLRASYPHRSAVPRDEWRRLFESAEQEIGILVYSGLFLAEDVDLMRIVAAKARGGVTVRLLLGDPDSPQVAERGMEERIDDALAAKVRNAIVLYRPLLEDGAQVRTHRTVLYNSIYRADEEMLVNVHAYGIAAASAPVLRLRQAGYGDLITAYQASFERVWQIGAPLT